MRIRFIGPVGRVTGSCYHLQHKGTEFLVDCGLRQEGLPGDNAWNEGRWPFEPRRLRAVILTHAHVDHCGLIPKLVRDGFAGTVYATEETSELARHILQDAAKRGAPYSMRDSERVRFHPVAQGRFGRAHPIATDLFVTFHRSGHILGAVSPQVSWGPKGPSQCSIAFSGDLGPNVKGARMQALNRHGNRPFMTMPRGVPYRRRYAVLESTYGDRPRVAGALDSETRLQALLDAVRSAMASGGVLLVPAFAMERTPAILFDLAVLRARHPAELGDLPIYLHAPLARRLLPIYAKGLGATDAKSSGAVKPRWLGDEAIRLLGLAPDSYAEVGLALRIVERLFKGKRHGRSANVEGCSVPEAEEIAGRHAPSFIPCERRPASLAGPAIVVTGGGMMDGGAVGSYVDLLADPTTVLALVGYVSHSSNAARILRGAGTLPEARQLLNEVLSFGEGRYASSLALREVNCQVVTLGGYSGHADQGGLVDWVYRVHRGVPETVAETVFLTHGTDQARRALAAAIEARGSAAIDSTGARWQPAQVEIPQPDDGWFDLDRGEWEAEELNELEQLRRERDRITKRMKELEAAGAGIEPGRRAASS